MKYTEKELLVIWLDSFHGIDYKNKRALKDLICDKPDIKRTIESNKTEITAVLGETGYNALLCSANPDYLKDTLNKLAAAGEIAVTVESENYPARLKEIPDPPLALYCRGNVELLKNEIFGVVGSRKSIPLSLSIAKDFSLELIKGGFTLATGTAEGVDSEVLKAGLKSGAVIAVSASGLNNIYPQQNAGLIDKIAENGLVISEQREDVKAMPFMFPVRNRIIAGLSSGALIVSGRIKSGTMYTAGYALDYGRDLFAVPYSVGIESGAGTNELIKNGANLADSPKDILSFYGIESEEQDETDLTDTEREILSALKDSPLHIEKIAEQTNKQIYEITSALTVLEIKGVVYKNGTNTYGLVRNREI